MRADNTPSLRDAESRRRDQLTERALGVIRQLSSDGSSVTFAGVARESGVSRSFLYRSPEIAREIEQHRGTLSPVPPAERMSEVSRLARLEQLRADNARLRAENAELRQQNAVLLGELRRGSATA
jgi:hypothetical protein